MTRNVLELPTLVLNRNWQPVHVTTVVRALVMLWNETAKVVEPEEYRLYDWAAWSELEPLNGSPCVRSAHRSFRVPEVICLAHYDRLPGSGGDVQPAECRQAGPPHLPVLRGAARRRGDHDRPRHAPLAGGCVELDELRRRVRRLQCPQGRPHAGAGRHEASAHPVRPEWKPLYAAHGVRVESWARFLSA